MLEVVLAFVGSWLLVAGPLYQGAVELQQEGVDEDGIADVIGQVQPSPAPSEWWWLLPPVMFVKRRQRSAKFWREVLQIVSPEQARQIRATRPRVIGWFVVSLGALFLAVGETVRLSDRIEIPVGIALLLAVAILAVTLGVVRLALTRRRQA